MKKQEPRPAYHRRKDLERLREHAKDLPLILSDNGRAYEVRTPDILPAAPPIIAGRHEVVWAFIAGWRGAQQRALGTSHWLDSAMEAEDAALTPADEELIHERGTIAGLKRRLADKDEELLKANLKVEAFREATDLASRMLDMLERVEWVRASGGSHTVCPFCHAVNEQDGGPGHTEECEGQQARREGNELRVDGVLR